MKFGEFIYITEGSRIILKDKAYRYAYAFFVPERPGIYLYTYAYQEEENWCIYREEYSSREWIGTDTVFDEKNLPPQKEGYIRITVTGENGEVVQAPEQILEVVSERSEKAALLSKETAFLSRADVRTEITETVRTVQEKRTENSLVLTLLSDTHYVINGNWETCAATIEAVNGQIKPDGVVHLGDLTDGILDQKICRNYSRRILDRIRGWGMPFYMTIGNHDVNYFKKNPYILSKTEQYDYYLRDIVSGELTEGQLWYHADFPKQKLRCLFLHSYDNSEKLRYGFPQEELDWIQQKLEETPPAYQVILFSHEAPLARLDYWANEIRGGETLTEALDLWNTEHDNRILAFIHGHTHADFIYRKRTFPIVSVGCSKIEYFEDKKPDGAIRPVRAEGEVSQELWDTVIINTEQRRIDFVRFGAGTDRSICGMKTPQIWAHRGASGYAPENTLEAFALAEQLGADGIELDVQFTKDRELVVIHDERIDRVSDGRGAVADYALEELRRFHFNRTHPQYRHAVIPTLREVLELVRPTRLTVNIELKTGINFYPGIEKETVKLVEEMGMRERVIYSSFNHASVMKIKELAPYARTGFLYCDGTLDMADYAQEHQTDALHPAYYNIKYPGFVQDCRKKGIKLHVWTVNDRNVMEQMRQYGVDAVITNYPNIAYEVYFGKTLTVPAPPEAEPEPLPAQVQAAGKLKEPEKKPEAAEIKRQEKTQEAAKAEAVEKLQETAEKEEKESAEKPSNTENAVGGKCWPLHLAGVAYSKVRKVFVAIDAAVQKAAGKR